MIVTAKILSIKPHPQAHSLRLCQVSDGTNTHQIVCGSPNIFESMITILAKEGATTPTGLAIHKANLRGQDSHGMICSPRELGLRNEAGAIDLPPTTPLGKPWNELDPLTLSSTPWYQYDLVEEFIQMPEGQVVALHHFWNEQEVKSKSTLISRTYFDSKENVYRYQRLVD